MTYALALFLTLLLTATARWIFVNGRRIGREIQHASDVDFVSRRAQEEYRQSWRDIAWELKENKSAK